MASERKRKNTISKLTMENGEVVMEQRDISEVAVNYFQDLFRGSQGVYDDVLNHVGTRLNAYDNEALLKPFEIAEFKQTIF